MKRKYNSLRPLAILTALLLAFFALGGPVRAGENWRTDPSTGCKIWTSSVAESATFTWTGGCKNGYLDGTGTLQWFESGVPGDKYIGSLSQGKMHGRGVFIWAFPAARYDGDFLGGQRSGKGAQTFANGDRYDGNWLADQPHGTGTYVWINEDRYQGDFDAGKAQGKGVKTWTDGTRYEGDFVNGQPNGKGVKTWAKGARYEGDFINGQLHGYGVFTLRNGRVFRGRWANSNYLGP